MSHHVCDVMWWVKWSQLSCGLTVLQYCCCLIAILPAWKHFLKSSHWEGSTSVKNERDVMCLPAHYVTVIIFATFKMCYEHFRSTKLQYSAYLRQIIFIKKVLIFCCQCPLRWLHTVSWKVENTCFRSKISCIGIFLEEWN